MIKADDRAMMRAYLTSIHNRLLAEGALSDNPSAINEIMQELTALVKAIAQSGLSIATSYRGGLAANHKNRFDILAQEQIIDLDLARGLSTAVNSWVLLASKPEEIDEKLVRNFCGYFLEDFEKYERLVPPFGASAETILRKSERQQTATSAQAVILNGSRNQATNSAT